MTPQDVPSSGTESASRVADVLLAFLNDGRPLGVSDISRQLGISKAVVHRILQSLVSRQLLSPSEEGRRYELGPLAHALGARALQASSLRNVAMPVLRMIARQTHETVTVSELIGDARVYLDQVPSFQEIRMTVELGRPFPLHAGSSGRAILAFCPPDFIDEILSGSLPLLTGSTMTDPEQVRASLLETRRLGAAISQGERQREAGSVAAPVFNLRDEVVGSISICGPISRVDRAALQDFVPLVKHAAREVSLRLDHSRTS